MSRSSPCWPLALSAGPDAVRRVLRERGEAMTPVEIRDVLVDEGFRWPCRHTVSPRGPDSPRVTLDKVRRALRSLHGYSVEHVDGDRWRAYR